MCILPRVTVRYRRLGVSKVTVITGKTKACFSDCLWRSSAGGEMSFKGWSEIAHSLRVWVFATSHPVWKQQWFCGSHGVDGT